jgi:hypothetical protein
MRSSGEMKLSNLLYRLHDSKEGVMTRRRPGLALVAISLVLTAAGFVTLVAALAGTAEADISPANSSGYVWINNSPPDPQTTFTWVDATGGTILTSTDDDDNFDVVTLPFTFNFFGTDYTQIAIGTNGLLSFDTADAGGCNDNYNWGPDGFGSGIPHDDAICEDGFDGWGANPLIASWFDDLDPGECGDVYYQSFGTAPNQTFVVEFSDVCHNDCFDCAVGEGVTFETILYEGSNDLKVQYMDAFFGTGGEGGEGIAESNNGASATTGINLDGTTGLQYSWKTASLSDGLAVLYTTQVPTPTPTASPPGAPTATPTATAVTPTPTSTGGPSALPPTGDDPSSDVGPDAGWMLLPALASALAVIAAWRVRARRGR